MASERRGKRVIWIVAIIVLVGIAAFAIWRWAMANQSVATLDRIDRFFRGDGTELAAGPVNYGEHPAQTLYVYRAKAAANDTEKPVLLFIHGGAWNSGYPGDYAFVGRNFAPRGFVVVKAGYRLVPDGKFPAMLEDGAAAVRWVHDNIGELGGDPQRIYLMGHSAGAYNAMMLGLDPQWLGREGLDGDVIKGVIGLSGPYDFDTKDRGSLEAAFGHWERPRATQPVNFARADAPPLLIATGDKDTTVRPRNSESLARAMTEAGVPTEAVIFEGMNHIDPILTLAKPFARDSRVEDAIAAFLAEQERVATPNETVSVQVQAQNR